MLGSFFEVEKHMASDDAEKSWTAQSITGDADCCDVCINFISDYDEHYDRDCSRRTVSRDMIESERLSYSTKYMT